MEVLKKIDSPHVAKLFESDTYNGLPFEILPYFKSGSLQGKTFTSDHIKRHIIPSINEGLHVLHKNGILHKDLKPSNIMLCDNGLDVCIIDFGISSARNNENTVIVTKTGMTPEYSAPETFRNLFLEESDYYSFGITLFELFCGYTPYRNMDAEAIEQYMSVQRIPFPETMPSELSDFISAVTYYDITNRKNKNNPNRRWTYDEVRRWCSGEILTIPGEGIGNEKSGILPYVFLNEAYSDLASLVDALVLNWSDGKKQLFRGLLSGYFKSRNPEIAGFCLDAEEAASKNEKDDLIFFRLLYKLNPNTKAFYWKGKIYQGLSAFGRIMLDQLWSGSKDLVFYDEVLSERLLSAYIDQVDPENTEIKDAVKGLEDGYVLNCPTASDKLLHYYLVAYMLSGQKLLRIDKLDFRTVGELAEYMKHLLDDSFDKFQYFCHRMINYDDHLNEQLEAWLIAIGKRKELDEWRRSLAD
jgi:serine/threonine protein kinase